MEAILDYLIPGDEAPGATALVLAPRVAAALPELEELLVRLAGFADRPADEQVAILVGLDRTADPTYARLVVAAHEAYWADPRSWPTVGYTTNVRGRP